MALVVVLSFNKLFAMHVRATFTTCYGIIEHSQTLTLLQNHPRLKADFTLAQPEE